MGWMERVQGMFQKKVEPVRKTSMLPSILTPVFSKSHIFIGVFVCINLKRKLIGGNSTFFFPCPRCAISRECYSRAVSEAQDQT